MPVPYLTLEGRVVGDVQFKFTDDGMPVARFRMVCVDRKKTPAGDWVDGAEFWVTVSCFRRLAENVADSVKDKHQVVVTGKLSTSEWFETDGSKRSAPKVVASNVARSLVFDAIPTEGARRPPRETPAQRPQVPAGAPRTDSQGSDESWGVSEPWSGPGTQDDPWA